MFQIVLFSLSFLVRPEETSRRKWTVRKKTAVNYESKGMMKKQNSRLKIQFSMGGEMRDE